MPCTLAGQQDNMKLPISANRGQRSLGLEDQPMVKRFWALFDGEVLRPDDPPGLKPNMRYVVTVEHDGGEREPGRGDIYPLSAILGLATDMGVTDLSTRHSWYAHGRLEDDGRGA